MVRIRLCSPAIHGERYKAAYDKGGGTNAGYWTYGTQSDAAPTVVSANSSGDGSAGSTGNLANYNKGADWNAQHGNVTTVGTNGGGSAYGAWDSDHTINVSSAQRFEIDPSSEGFGTGFRLAAVPEPSTCAMALAGFACGGWQML